MPNKMSESKSCTSIISDWNTNCVASDPIPSSRGGTSGWSNAVQSKELAPIRPELAPGKAWQIKIHIHNIYIYIYFFYYVLSWSSWKMIFQQFQSLDLDVPLENISMLYSYSRIVIFGLNIMNTNVKCRNLFVLNSTFFSKIVQNFQLLCYPPQNSCACHHPSGPMSEFPQPQIKRITSTQIYLPEIQVPLGYKYRLDKSWRSIFTKVP